jgi:hypothetical protein
VAATEWLRFWGFSDARTCGPGADGGVDVESAEIVAQVKARVSTAGRPELQQLFGVAASRGKRAVFFSIGGYTTQAIGWANEVGIALFGFDLQGEPAPLNAIASELSQMELQISSLLNAATASGATDGDNASVLEESPKLASLPSPAPEDWAPGGSNTAFVKYARRLQRNSHRVTGYAVRFADSANDQALIKSWADVGVVGNYVVVDHDSGRVEGYETWNEAYAATCEWDGGWLAPSVLKSLRRGQESPDLSA